MTGDGARRVSVSGGELSALDVGHPEAPAVVLIHGFPTSSFLWRSFAPSLATQMRVLAPDLLGAGESERPVDAALDAGAQAGYVRELVGSLGVPRFAVVGHGDGGTVAQLLCVQDGVDALVLIDSAGPHGSPAAAMARRVSGTTDEPHALVAEALRLGSARPERIPPDVAREYARPFGRPGGAEALSRWGAAAGSYPPSLGEELTHIDVPTLLLWGEDDPFVPTEVAEGLNERIETSSLALLPGCGHFLPEEAAATIVPLVAQWLAGRYLGRTHNHPHGPVLVQLDPRRREADR